MNKKELQLDVEFSKEKFNAISFVEEILSMSKKDVKKCEKTYADSNHRREHK